MKSPVLERIPSIENVLTDSPGDVIPHERECAAICALQDGISCPHRILQGLCAIGPATGRFACYFMQTLQWLAADSLREMGRDPGSIGREFFCGRRESSEPCGEFIARARAGDRVLRSAWGYRIPAGLEIFGNQIPNLRTSTENTEIQAQEICRRMGEQQRAQMPAVARNCRTSLVKREGGTKSQLRDMALLPGYNA
jgi:hypothetical protein